LLNDDLVADSGKDNSARQAAATRHAVGPRAVSEGASRRQAGDEGAPRFSVRADRHLQRGDRQEEEQHVKSRLHLQEQHQGITTSLVHCTCSVHQIK